MKLLHALYFHPMPLAAHFRFFTQLSGLLAAAGEDLKTAVATLMPDFNAWLAKEDAVTDWIRRSALTEKIAEADVEINRVLVGINAVVQSGRHSPVPAIKDSAERVYIMMKNYGYVVNESYDVKAGDVAKLLEQFGSDYIQDASNLGLIAWVQQLQTALTAFDALLRQRADERVEKPPYSAEEVRKGIEGVYHPMMDILEGNAIAGTSTEFLTFINRLNPEIDRLNEEFHRAKKDLSVGDHTVIEPIETQKYTEEPITPIPKVHYCEDEKPTVKLWLGKDFDVTYKNNINVGMAEVTIHGKGDYKGQKSVAFNIAR
jgi:hypothetical protein